MQELNNPNSFGGFHEASAAVLRHLHETMGFDLWMVTRAEGENWIVLESDDHGYGVRQGDVFRWTDSFCCRMVDGLGPRIAPCSKAVAPYASAPIGQQVQIGAYVGVPLSCEDGRLFGTLCAIHPTPRPEWIEKKLPLVELFGGLLANILQAEFKASEQTRIAERAQTDSMTDTLTGLYNRRGWNQLVFAEEKRAQRYGHPSCVISIDIDYLKMINDMQGHAKGDELIQRVATTIASTIRAQDIAARLGGDEFAILAVECDVAGSETLYERLESELSSAGVHASMGSCMCKPGKPFAETLDIADQAMYAKKRKQRATPPSLAAFPSRVSEFAPQTDQPR